MRELTLTLTLKSKMRELGWKHFITTEGLCHLQSIMIIHHLTSSHVVLHNGAVATIAMTTRPTPSSLNAFLVVDVVHKQLWRVGTATVFFKPPTTEPGNTPDRLAARLVALQLGIQNACSNYSH